MAKITYGTGSATYISAGPVTNEKTYTTSINFPSKNKNNLNEQDLCQ